MTRRWSKGMAGEKYLGNKEKKEVHNLEAEKPECNIEQIIQAEYDIAFRTIDDAHDQGYSHCPYCMEDEGEACKI